MAARVEIRFPHRRAGHCGSGALRDLLEFHGLSWGAEPLREGMVFGLGAGLGFAYVELPGMDPPLYLVGRTGGLERDVCEHLGIGLDLRQTDDADEGWARLKGALDAGRPTMVWADIRELEYLRVRLQMTMHDFVITGYDEAEGVAFVADNDRDEVQRCSLAALARARHSDGFPSPNRHGTWLMDFPGALPEPAEAVRRGIAGAVANMRGGGESLTAAPDALGLAGVASFAAGFAGWPERFGEQLDAALRGLRVFVVKAGTGGALFRSLHAGFLHDAGALLDDDRLRAAGALYDELAGAWVAAAEAGSHAAAAPHVTRAAELEAAGVAAMEAWLG
ncbi:MAG: BtrH N-terminal domain-containing protein [Actinomycetota bacterium]|nr:BtrH N-terminal domain-containing protein [Actinomycetota bacterium]